MAAHARSGYLTQSNAGEVREAFSCYPACPAVEKRRVRGRPSTQSEEQMLRPRPREQGPFRVLSVRLEKRWRLTTAKARMVGKESEHEGQRRPY